MVITFQDVSFKYVDRYLLKDASFTVTEKDKTGLMGVNGSGKSTLLKLVLGQEKPVSGNIVRSGNIQINYLEQNQVFGPTETVYSAISSRGTKDHPVPDYEIKAMLNHLKLTNYDALCKNLSGGEKKRLSLAIALLTYCDILLLDEPTNHLDQDTILWLEKFLIKWPHGLLLVTHDRYFLERVCSKMLELDHGTVYSYEANYSKYLELKEQREANQAHQEQKVRSLLKNELAWIRAGAPARSTKQKGRIQRFEKLSAIKFEKDQSLSMSSLKTRLGNDTIEIKNAAMSMDGRLLFKDFSYNLPRYSRTGIVGNNGCGKTTLFKAIMGKLKLDSGEILIGETIKIGYFAQEMEEMNPEEKVIDYISRAGDRIETLDGEISAKQLLETFLFDSTKQYSPIKVLSGGEKRRLQLLRVLMSNPNVLILDEPTNDLDIYTLEVLENYLENFKGPVLVVSHDRYFLDKICDTLLAFEGTSINKYTCTVSEYLEKEAEQEEKPKEVKTERVRTHPSTGKLRDRLAYLEKHTLALHAEIKALDDKLSTPISDYHKINDLTAEREAKAKQVEEEENEYLETLDELDKALSDV
ncbi:MAG: ABC-F family ATP-binding cassette domain-containing protein [Bacilli bacterium]|jgi:ATP-binding cassette subfamily F protein uup